VILSKKKRGRERKGTVEKRKKMRNNKGAPCDKSKALLTCGFFFTPSHTFQIPRTKPYLGSNPKGISHKNKYKNANFTYRIYQDL